MCHCLNIDLDRKPIRQKRRAIDAERYQALKDEVDILLVNGFIKGSFYPSWLANPVLVKKPNDKWRTYVNFIDLNNAFPKDSFPLPQIDQLVDAISGHQLLNFMDRDLYCYKVMPFGLKNVGATYQLLVNMMFKE